MKLFSGTTVIIFLTLAALLLMGCNQQEDEPVPTGNTIKAIDDGSQDSGSASDSDDEFAITCNQDSDCGTTEYRDSYCFQGNKFDKKKIYTCVFPGTPQSYCNAEIKESMVGCDRSSELCSSGECVAIASLPCRDSDGGNAPDIPGKVVDPTGWEIGDECLGKTTLLEAVCQSPGKGKATTVQVDCDFECRQGECITEKEKYNLG